MKKGKSKDNKDNNSAGINNNEEMLISDQKLSEQTNVPAKTEIQDLNDKYALLDDKYMRLYADFENYKKKVIKEKEELIKYGLETCFYELLPAIDGLELALAHAAGNSNDGLMQGVEMTLKELHRTLEKFGLSKISAKGKNFDPAVHHAMMRVEREDIDEKLVVEELRPGYMYRDKVLRPSLVAVSVKPQGKTAVHDSAVNEQEDEGTGNDVAGSDNDSENNEIETNKKIEEE